MPRHPLLQRNLVIITLLSLIAIAQTAWWVIFQVQEGRRLHNEQAHIWRQQIAVVEAIMEAHPDSADTYLEPVAKHFTDLQINPELGSVVVRQEAREALNDLAYGRIRMFASEGAFFILLIVAGIAYVYWTAAREAQNERLQLNFLHAVSHELRTPVSSLNLSLETFEMRELQPAQKADLLERMHQDLDRLNGQIDYLLRAQSLVRGELHLRPVDQDLSRLTREAVEFYRPLFVQRGIELATDIEADVHLQTDGPHYVIMVRNLIDNAFKHADAKRVEVRLCLDDKGVRLEVADDGRGIPHNLHRRIFQRFFRPGSEDRRTTHGAGLGLYLVQQFAQTLGGRSYVSSEGHGRGATFVIELPRS